MGGNDKSDCHLDVLGAVTYMPNNEKIPPSASTEKDEGHEITPLFSPESSSYSLTPPTSPPRSPVPSSPSTNRLVSQSAPSTPLRTTSVSAASAAIRTLSTVSPNDAEIREELNRIMNPLPVGCEYLGENYLTLKKKYPSLTPVDIVRFLVARKGNIANAEQMIDKYLAWKLEHFPIKHSTVKNAFLSKCFFPYGRSRDGSPIVIMRGCLYNSKVATPYEYVMAASYCIEWALANNPGQPSVTVLVHTAQVEGGPNEIADMAFMKLFVQVLGDNFPERLKRLALYPFPLYGRMLWKVIGVFLDKRTQEKIQLLNPSRHDPGGFPSQLNQYIDRSEIPTCIGGTATAPPYDLLETLSD